MTPAVQAVICGRRRVQVTKTFTQNATWTAPITTSRVDAVGKGAAGTPSSYSGDQPRSASIDTVIVNSGSGGATPGSFRWDDFTDAAAAASKINGGGSGTVQGVYYQGYAGDNTFSVSVVSASYSNAIPGAASPGYQAGWQASGALPQNVSTNSYVTWYEYGTTTAATTGASATGFGQTFPGGAGGPATATTASNITVTPGATYNIVVPAGGSLTITYFQ